MSQIGLQFPDPLNKLRVWVGGNLRNGWNYGLVGINKCHVWSSSCTRRYLWVHSHQLLWWSKASANERKGGLLKNAYVRKHLDMNISLSVYYYFALKQGALILCMCSLASHPTKLDCHMSQIGFLEGGVGVGRPLSFPVLHFPGRTIWKIKCSDCIPFSINQNKVTQTSGYGPNGEEGKRTAGRAELKDCLGHVIL